MSLFGGACDSTSLIIGMALLGQRTLLGVYNLTGAPKHHANFSPKLDIQPHFPQVLIQWETPSQFLVNPLRPYPMKVPLHLYFSTESTPQIQNISLLASRNPHFFCSN
jgi:hypothetical protein